jgi:hypothetical protein
MQFAKVKNAFSRWLHIEDDDFIDVGLATVIAHGFPGDPVWLFLVGPSGCGKTEFLSALRTERIYHLTQFTPNTLVSGLNQSKKKDPSLLPDLDEKVVVIKDFTAILSENPKTRSQIFGQLRDVYDGSTAKAFGSGVRTRRYDCHVGLIAGVTPAIEKYQSLDQVLGERFLNYRISYVRPEMAVEKARQNAGSQTQMRSELEGVVTEFLREERPCSPDAIAVPPIFAEMIQSLASTVAALRTSVPKNRSGEVQYVPETEIGTRLVVQLTKLGSALAMARGRSEFTQAEYDVLLKVARHSVPTLRMRIVAALMHKSGALNKWVTTTELDKETKLPGASVRAAADDLRLLGLVDKEGESPIKWRPGERLKEMLAQSEFLLIDNKLELSVVQIPGGAGERVYRGEGG